MTDICPFCGEPCDIETEAIRMLQHDGAMPEESGLRPVHLECLCRSVMGSVGHQRGECSCTGEEDTSEEGLAHRQAARAALAYYREHNVRPLRGPERN